MVEYPSSPKPPIRSPRCRACVGDSEGYVVGIYDCLNQILPIEGAVGIKYLDPISYR